MKKEEHLEKFEKLAQATQKLSEQEQRDICMFIQGYIVCKKSGYKKMPEVKNSVKKGGTNKYEIR